MLSIVTVTYNSYDFLYLLLESLDRFTSIDYRVIVVDNSDVPLGIKAPHVIPLVQHKNIGHGAGLNLGVKSAIEEFPDHAYLMFLDVDCHILCHDWEAPLLTAMNTYDFVGGRGVPVKPLRPSCCFMKREIGRYDWRDTPGYKGHRVTPQGYDVAIKAYHKMVCDGVKIGFLEPARPNRYGTLNGEEWALNGQSLVYHHWHGTHLKERAVDFPDADLEADKKSLFTQIPWRNL